MNNMKHFYVTLMIITYMKVENLSLKRDKKKENQFETINI